MQSDIEIATPDLLLVDDEKEVADAYALRLDGVADVTIAYSGEAALSAVDTGNPPDVILLDRHMPGLSGDEVFVKLRDRGLRTRIIMITAIEPGLDILDLQFDDYLCKPVEREDVRAAVEQQCRVLVYELLGEYLKLESKRAIIDAQFPQERLTDHDELSDLEGRTDDLRARLDRLLSGSDELLTAFADIKREGY